MKKKLHMMGKEYGVGGPLNDAAAQARKFKFGEPQAAPAKEGSTATETGKPVTFGIGGVDTTTAIEGEKPLPSFE